MYSVYRLYMEGDLFQCPMHLHFLLSDRLDTADSEGCAVTLILEESRPVAAEVQGLVSWSHGSGHSGRGWNFIITITSHSGSSGETGWYFIQ